MSHDRKPWNTPKQPPQPPKARRKYKFKPRTCALQETRKYQKSTNSIISKVLFALWYEKSLMKSITMLHECKARVICSQRHLLYQCQRLYFKFYHLATSIENVKNDVNAIQCDIWHGDHRVYMKDSPHNTRVQVSSFEIVFTLTQESLE